MKALQILSREYVHKSLQASLAERLEFLEEFRRLLPLSVYEDHYANRRMEWSSGEKDMFYHEDLPTHRETESAPRNESV